MDPQRRLALRGETGKVNAAPVEPLGLGRALARPVWAWWQRYRFRARAALALDWQHPPYVNFAGPDTYRRAVKLTVTPPKDEQFVVEKGTVEARTAPGRPWNAVLDLNQVLGRSLVVAGVPWGGRISGKSLAQALRARSASDEADLRVTLHDPYDRKVRSDVLSVTVRELEKEEDW